MKLSTQYWFYVSIYFSTKIPVYSPWKLDDIRSFLWPEVTLPFPITVTVHPCLSQRLEATSAATNRRTKKENNLNLTKEKKERKIFSFIWSNKEKHEERKKKNKITIVSVYSISLSSETSLIFFASRSKSRKKFFNSSASIYPLLSLSYSRQI